MNSLADLNIFGQTQITVNDSRLATVTFDRRYPQLPQDQVFEISSAIVVPNPGIEITEIVNYQTANVRYRVKIIRGDQNPLPNTSIAWGTLPGGVTASQSGDTYTLTGIKSVIDWNAVKTFTWNLPGTYESYPTWYLEVSVIYFDQAIGTDITKTWLVYDPDHYYVAKLYSNFNVDGLVNSISSASADLYSQFVCQYKLLIEAQSAFTMDATALKAKTLAAAMSMTATATATGSILVQNLTPRSFNTNQSTAIFATDTPILDTGNTVPNYKVRITSPNGKFSLSKTELPVSVFEIIGTVANINSQMTNVRFFPNKDYTSNTTYTFSFYENTNLMFTSTQALTAVVVGFTTQTLTFNSSQYWTPDFDQITYAVADVLIVGAGGGGCAGGGGGGQVLERFNQTLTPTAYNITVGNGGTGRNPLGTTIGGQGGSSKFGTITALGGYGGKYVTTDVDIAGGGGNFGGHPGNTNSYTGAGGGGYDANLSQGTWGGGGGGGAGLPPGVTIGADGAGNYDTSGATYWGEGGIGLQSTITGNYYGGGGGGGSSWSSVTYGGRYQANPGPGSTGGVTGKEGGAGNGGYNSTAGTANTGGGGGGGYNASRIGKNGGSGVVVVKLHS